MRLPRIQLFARPTPGQGIALLLLSLAAFGYPLLGAWAIEQFGTPATSAVLLAVAVAGWGLRSAVEGRPGWLLLQNAGALVLLGLAAATGDRTYLLLFPALINLYLAVIFAGSLATEQSIVERGARILQPYLPPFTVAYCRKLTLFWAAFFVANTGWIGALALGPAEAWRNYTVVAYPLSIGAISAVEFVVRKVWFRYYTEAPFDRLLAAIWPAEANERGRRSQHYVATLRAAGYGPGGEHSGEPLDPAVIAELTQG